MPSFSTPGPADRCWVEIDLEAVRHNCLVAQSRLPGPEAGIIGVVKANAYGLGMIPLATAMTGTVRAFGVANVTEAMALREAEPEKPIYILGPALPAEWEAVAAGGFCAAVSSLEEVAGYAAAGARLGRRVDLHVVIDTGMGRIGALPGQAATLIRRVLTDPHLRLDSVASHFPSADEDPQFTREQASGFHQLLRELEQEGPAMAVAPIQFANSAALLQNPPPQENWARAGMMLYGIAPVPERQQDLRTVVSWKTRISLIRELPAGQGVSYGRTFVTARRTRVATLATGYADGFPRHASGRGACVLVGGQRCPVLGRITMDQMMVDISEVSTPVMPGDEAVFIGRQGSGEITAVELAEWSGTIVWDLFTGIGPRVRRFYRHPSL